MTKLKVSFVAFVVTFACIVGAAALLADPSAPSAAESHIAHRTDDEQRTIDVYRRSQEAVAFITTLSVAVDPFDFFPELQSREGSGSGIVVDAQRGIVLTNLHVIQDAQKIEISIAGKGFRAKLLGFDEESDIAVLQILEAPPNLVAIPMGDSSQLAVGQRVLAIGNPFGLERTLTAGIISSLNRTVRGSKGRLLRDLIQTDAAINPGNSGGPLLDTEGRLIGINTAILSASGDSAGIGFAVPINHIRRILPELIATGKVLRPKLGWVLVDTNQGPMVRRVLPGSPAEAAGVQPIEKPVEAGFVRGFVRDFERADIIVAVNGSEVGSRDDVEQLVNAAPPKKTIQLKLRRGGRGGRERTVAVEPVLG